MPPFRRKTTIESTLKDRVREAAVEAARESQQRMIEAAREVAQPTSGDAREQLRAAVAQLDVPLGALGAGTLGPRALHAVRDEPCARSLRGTPCDRH